MSDQRIETFLGHTFSDRDLLEQALTHRSAGSRHNERLEFLGDAVLSFLVGEALFRTEADAPEGRLTRLRAQLVRQESLASLARDLHLGTVLRLGGGELKSGGRDRDSILADAMEAVIGAMYLDAGFEATRRSVTRLLAERLERVQTEETAKDAKTRLQEVLQAKGLPLPAYRVIEVEGAAHAQRFTVECAVTGLEVGVQGVGASRRKAEQDAAGRAIGLLARATHDEQSGLGGQ